MDTTSTDDGLANFAKYLAIEMTNETLPNRIEIAKRVLKQYGMHERIDENEQWLRHIGPAWDAEGVLADDVNKRLTALKDK